MKKVTLILAALALVLGISQCKKQESAHVGEEQHVVLNASFAQGNSKIDQNGTRLKWATGDKLTVGGAGSGELTCTDPENGTFEGTIRFNEGSTITFTFGTMPVYTGQTGLLNDAVCLEGNATYNREGKYGATMTMPHAVLKLDVSALGITGPLTITSGGEIVASVENVTSIADNVFVAVPANNESAQYTFQIGDNTATKNWPALKQNTFYTMQDTDGDAIVVNSAPNFIDLGLPTGTLWADRNLGAADEQYVGNYYPWGEIELWYESISGNTVTMKSDYKNFSADEYRDKSNMNTADANLTGENIIYDAAHVALGGDCCIPSDPQFKELYDNCYFKYVSSYNGQSVEGYIVYKAKADADKGKRTLPNGAYVPTGTYSLSDTHIFLPYTGYLKNHGVFSGALEGGPSGITAGYYWSSTSGTISGTTTKGAWRHAIGSNFTSPHAIINRWPALAIRPVKPAPEKPHDAVKIGNLYWATCNIGANSQEQVGRHFAWGDVVGQTAATNGEGAFTTAFSSANRPEPTLVGGTTLSPEYDAAHVNWGGNWRMPTKEEIDDLIANTNYDVVEDFEGTGVSGYLFTSKADNTKSIFFPKTGIGDNNKLPVGGIKIGHI